MRAARLAAQKGLRTAVIEKKHWGGTCVNLGCIPKKYMVLAGDYHKNLSAARDYGWRLNQAAFDWQTLRAALHKETGRLQSVYREILTAAGAELIEGEGRFLSPTEVQVGASRYKASRMLLATGSHPFVPPIKGKEYGWVSDDIFSLPQLPGRIAIVGGGYIALEFASILCSLGVEVTLIHRSERLLRQLDEELFQFLIAEMDKRIRLLLSTQVVAIDKHDDQTLSLRLSGKKGDSQLRVDGVLFAVGRIPNTHLDLTKAGVEQGEKGELLVDEDYRTSQPHIFAIGDLIGKRALTPVAIAEARTLIASDFGARRTAKLNYDAIPTAIFCRPELAMVGKTEASARESGEVEVHRSAFFPMKQMLSKEPSRFLVKILCEKGNGRLLGIHLAGEDAAEILQGFAVAYAAGLSKKELDRTIGIHPTLAEELVSLR